MEKTLVEISLDEKGNFVDEDRLKVKAKPLGISAGILVPIHKNSSKFGTYGDFEIQEAAEEVKKHYEDYVSGCENKGSVEEADAYVFSRTNKSNLKYAPLVSAHFDGHATWCTTGSIQFYKILEEETGRAIRYRLKNEIV